MQTLLGHGSAAQLAMHVASGPGRGELGSLPAFEEFQRDIAAGAETGPDAVPATVVGTYAS